MALRGIFQYDVMEVLQFGCAPEVCREIEIPIKNTLYETEILVK